MHYLYKGGRYAFLAEVDDDAAGVGHPWVRVEKVWFGRHCVKGLFFKDSICEC